MREPCGILIVNKPIGLTSHDVVGRVRRLFGTRRVGHTGTLDPLAEGVLVVLIGRAAKAAEYLVCDEKCYRATMRLGLTSDTEDITGTLVPSESPIPVQEQVLANCRNFVGQIQQIPPMYSALKVDGQKLYDLARRGITVERQARPITIHALTATPTDTPTDYLLDVTCSAGTYIRTLCADIGASLGCGAVMATLQRTAAGGFSLDSAHTLEELEAMNADERLACLLPTEHLFATLPAARLPAFYERLFRSGCEIYQKKIGTHLELGTRVRVCTADGKFFALGEVREYENGTAIKSIKLFDLDT